MKDIHEVLRRKQAKYAQLSKQIEALQQAAEKLREVAPLLAENEDEESSVLAEGEEVGNSAAAGAGSASASSSAAAPAKPAARAPRWP
jgi:chromosome segregation ATPase